MKLLLIITDFGSFENFLSELSVKFIENPKNSLDVICSKEKVINKNGNVKSEYPNIYFHYIDIPRKIGILSQIKSALEIRKVIKTINPDLIHSHFTTATFTTLLFKKTSSTYWGTFHGLGLNSSKGIKKIIFTLVESFCFNRLDKIFLVNNQDFKYLERKYQKKVTKYSCFGFGCDVDKFNPVRFSENYKKQLKIEYGIEEGQIVICFVGRFVNFKGFHLLIKSFNKLVSIYPDKFKLILIGGIDPIHKTGLNKNENKLYVSDKNIINIGFTPFVNRYLAISDIFLFPSKKEGLPTCLLEALSMGVPVITFNERGNNDVIVNNCNGILINSDKKNDIINILKSIELLAFNKKNRDKLIVNSLEERLKYSREFFIKESIFYYSNFIK